MTQSMNKQKVIPKEKKSKKVVRKIDLSQVSFLTMWPTKNLQQGGCGGGDALFTTLWNFFFLHETNTNLNWKDFETIAYPLL